MLALLICFPVWAQESPTKEVITTLEVTASPEVIATPEVTTATPEAVQHVKLKVAILDFKVEQGINVSVTTLTDNLITILRGLKRFSVVERERLNNILQEQGLSQSGLVEAATGTEVGKIKGIDILVTGGVGKLGSILTVNTRFIDIRTGEITATERVEGTSEEDLPAMTNTLAHKIEEAFPLMGYIVTLESDKSVMIDLGEEDGARKGSIFTVFQEKQIKHPVTGEIILRRKNIGTITVDEVEKDYSLCSITASTEAFQPGDKIFLAVGSRLETEGLPPLKPIAVATEEAKAKEGFFSEFYTLKPEENPGDQFYTNVFEHEGNQILIEARIADYYWVSNFEKGIKRIEVKFMVDNKLEALFSISADVLLGREFDEKGTYMYSVKVADLETDGARFKKLVIKFGIGNL
jgi:TolB-like protein